MSEHRNDLLDLHPASVAGALLGARPQQGPAPRAAEPELQRPQPSTLRRLLGSLRGREAAASAETGRAY